MALIEVKNAIKTYQMGDELFYAMNDISFEIEQGDFVAIMGASGSGKSTCMNMLGTLDKPNSGQYHLGGVDVFSLSPDELSDIRNNKIGFVFQGFNLISRTSAIDNVMMPMIYKGIPEEERYERARQALKIVGLDKKENNLPSQMSGGQQQRVAIARAIVNDAPIILADEPTGNLDTENGRIVIDHLKRLKNEAGYCVVIVTHDLGIAAEADVVYRMTDGRLVRDEGDSVC